MKNKIITICLILIVIVCIGITQLPGIYAVPTDYSDYMGIIISKEDNIQEKLLRNTYYSFRTPDDDLSDIYWNNYNTCNPTNNNFYIAEFYNDEQYSSAIIAGCNNPYPDIQIPQDYRHNLEKFWEYIFTISEYWKVYTAVGDYYDRTLVLLKPYNYIEPEYKIECNPKQITPGETSKCTLKANYHSKIKSINFKLDIADYTISDIKAGEDFDNLKIEDNIYSLISKDTLEDSEEGKEIDIITFNIKSNSEKIIGENNIKVLDIKYEDGLAESTTKTISETVNQEKIDIKELITNPKTRNNLIIIILLFSLITISIIINKKRNNNIK